jgi:hypothetical protein
MRAALFGYVRGRGVLRCRVGGRPGDLCSDLTIMTYLVPEQWRPRGLKSSGRLGFLQIGSSESLTSARTEHSGK